MKLFNSLTNQKEEFVPIKKGEVSIYVCGPTVYNYVHIGNTRPMIVFDILRRTFEYLGYKVTFVSNFTDVDDKIIKAAKEEGVSEKELTDENRECDIYLNWFNFSQELYSNSIELTFNSVDEKIENAILNLGVNNYTKLINYYSLNVYQIGFIESNGNINTSTSSHKILKISAKGIKSLKIIKEEESLSSSLCYGVFKKKDGSVNRIITYDLVGLEIKLTNEDRECDIYLNWFNYTNSPYASSMEIKLNSVDEKIENAINETINSLSLGAIKYYHCVDRPFNFQGKEIVFFGDSITEGFVDGSSITQNGYPKLFAESVGATYKNYGVGGSCFSMIYNGIDTVVNKVKLNLKNTSPFAFIAAGVNDWQCGATKEQLRSALVELCEWLETNYTGTVIFITPINFAGRTPIVTPQMTIWEVRQIITEVALTYNYNVVQGWMFPFPTEVGTYSSAVFGDGLHLTENHGYKVYSQSLKNTLC